ncbi:MAG: hypothetical protein IKH66_04560 [Campylobacter sp.]|nr:hypothetical protein [Campylobacter sp.]
MRKLLFLLPFLLFEFAFCASSFNDTCSFKLLVYSNNISEYLRKSSDGSLYVYRGFNESHDKYRFCRYELSETIEKSLYKEAFDGPINGFYSPTKDLKPDDSKFNDKIYEYYGHSDLCPANNGYYETYSYKIYEFTKNGDCIYCKFDEKFNYETKKCEPKCSDEEHYDVNTGKCIKPCVKIKDFHKRMDCYCKFFNKGNFTGDVFNPSKNYCKTGFDINVLLDNNSTCFNHLDAPSGVKDFACSIGCSNGVIGFRLKNGGVVSNEYLDEVKDFCDSGDPNSSSSASPDTSNLNDNSDSLTIDLTDFSVTSPNDDNDGDDGNSGATGNTGLNGGSDDSIYFVGNTGGNNNNNDNGNDNTGGGNSGGNNDNNGNGSTTITTDTNNTNPSGTTTDKNNTKPSGGNTPSGGGGNNQNNLDCENGNCELYGNIIIESSDNTDYMGEIDKMIDGGSLTGQIQDAITFFNKGYVPSIQNFPAPKSCVLSREFSGTKISPVKVDVDFCKVLSPLRDPFYMLFYISFVISFLIAGFKLLVVLFIGVK